jgi:hypothetical protein
MQNPLALLRFYAERVEDGQVPLDVMPFAISIHPKIKKKPTFTLPKADAARYPSEIQQEGAP